MPDILVLNSSLGSERSASQQLAATFVAELLQLSPDANIVTRDLATEPLPHLSPKTVGGIRGQPDTIPEHSARALSNHLIEELEAAAVVVIASPMHNFGIASTLKAYFDYVMRAGRTFRYTPTGPEGLLKGKRAVVIETRGGVYSEEPTRKLDSQEPYLRMMLRVIGIDDVTFVRAERLDKGPDLRAEALNTASCALRAYAGRLAETA
jgi:FMN-dependent NADH-azoreductase